MRLLKRGLEADPRNATTHQLFATMLQILERDDTEIVVAWERVLSIEPRHAAAHGHRAQHMARLGYDNSEVEAAYGRAVRRDPSMFWAHANRGNALKSLGRTKESLDAYDKCLAIESVDHVHMSRFWLLRTLDMQDELRAAIPTLPKLAPDLWKEPSTQIMIWSLFSRYDKMASVRAKGAPEEALVPLPLPASPDDGAQLALAAPELSEHVGGTPRFAFVQIYGPSNCGTSSLGAELGRLFEVKQIVQEWKHVLTAHMQQCKGVLNVVMVKDPYFWVQSMLRVPYPEDTFNKSNIAMPFEYQGKQIRGLAGFWNTHMVDYAHRFPRANTVVLRSSDLLFRFEECMAVLRARLHALPNADFSEAARLGHVGKEEDVRSRNLDQARAYYADSRNRLRGFSAQDLAYMRRTLDPELMDRWGYSHPSRADRSDEPEGRSRPGDGHAQVAGVGARKGRRRYNRKGRQGAAP